MPPTGYFPRVTTRPLLAVVVALSAPACHFGDQHFAHALSVATTIPPSSLLRVPAAGGIAELYQPPGLTPWGWRSSAPLPAVTQAVGADLDQDVVYLLDSQLQVTTLDLRTARPRPQGGAIVREAAIGPDGTLFTADDSNRVTQYVQRNPVRFSAALPSPPRDLFGTRGANLVAITGGRQTTLTLLRTDEVATQLAIPSGDAAATYWGDLVAIAADTAVVLADPDEGRIVASLPVSGHARAVLFSPSGHRFYVARREGGVLVFNRFTREQLGEIRLPGTAGSLRTDPFGRWLLLHPAGQDSLWVVDLASGRYAGGFAANWASDLPTVTNQQLLLVKIRGDVVAYDLAQAEFPEVGRVRDGARDFWLSLAWNPQTGTASTPVEGVPAADTTEAASAGAVYLQVSSSQNRDWSGELARQLHDAGLPARVLDPRQGEEGYRVVLGPYPTREVAESEGRKLGRPFFLYQPDR
jgi:hypothetical protein